ncbi:MAG: YraN family protein, partial [Gammaproteobacteria bacterium]
MARNYGTSSQRGRWAETLALEYLQDQGLILLTRNFHARCGEIDLIMEDDGIIVFCEVRYRVNNRYMHALESIDARKCAHIINAGRYYLQSHREASKKTCRFDVMAIHGPA